MRQKPNLFIERLCDSNGMKFERKTWKMMHVQKSETDKEKNKVNLEDLQDEDKLAKLMSQVLYLTQDDLEK